MVARQHRGGLEQVGVIGRRDAKIRLDEVAEGVDVEAPVAVAVESFHAEEALAFGSLEETRQGHVDAGRGGHEGIGVFDGPGIGHVFLGRELDDPMLESIRQVVLAGEEAFPAHADQHLGTGASWRAARAARPESRPGPTRRARE